MSIAPCFPTPSGVTLAERGDAESAVAKIAALRSRTAARAADRLRHVEAQLHGSTGPFDAARKLLDDTHDPAPEFRLQKAALQLETGFPLDAIPESKRLAGEEPAPGGVRRRAAFCSGVATPRAGDPEGAVTA